MTCDKLNNYKRFLKINNNEYKMKPNIAPLNTSFFLTSMIGFLISIFFIPQFSPTWAFAFAILFFIMFIASIISMFKGRPRPQLKI